MRVITFFKRLYKSLREIWSPKGSVFTMNMSGEKFKDDVAAQRGNYIALYFMCILITWSLLCLYGHDAFDSLFFQCPCREMSVWRLGRCHKQWNGH